MDGYPAAVHCSSSVDVATDFVSTAALFLLVWASAPSVLAEVLVSGSKTGLLRNWGWAEGNRLATGHSDLLLWTPVGGVVAPDEYMGAGAWISLSAAAAAAFFDKFLHLRLQTSIQVNCMLTYQFQSYETIDSH